MVKPEIQKVTGVCEEAWLRIVTLFPTPRAKRSLKRVSEAKGKEVLDGHLLGRPTPFPIELPEDLRKARDGGGRTLARKGGAAQGAESVGPGGTEGRQREGIGVGGGGRCATPLPPFCMIPRHLRYFL